MNNKVSFQQAIKAGALSAATAALINSILFFIFREAGILPDTVFVQPGQPLTVMSVIISSSIPLLLASIVFFLLEKYTGNGFKLFAAVSLVLGAISLISPFMALQNAPFSYALVLDVMHIVAVGALLYFISKAAYTKKAVIYQ